MFNGWTRGPRSGAVAHVENIDRFSGGVGGMRSSLRQITAELAELDIDADQLSGRSRRGSGQCRRGEGVTTQVGVAPLGELDSLNRDTAGQLSDLRRHLRGPLQGAPDLPAAHLRAGLAGQREGGEHRPVRLSVSLSKSGDLVADPVGVGRPARRVDQLRGGEPRNHPEQAGGHRGGDRRSATGPRRGLLRGEAIEQFRDRAVEQRGAASRNHDRPTISPRESMSMRVAPGLALKPGIVRISPQIG